MESDVQLRTHISDPSFVKNQVLSKKKLDLHIVLYTLILVASACSAIGYL